MFEHTQNRAFYGGQIQSIYSDFWAIVVGRYRSPFFSHVQLGPNYHMVVVQAESKIFANSRNFITDTLVRLPLTSVFSPLDLPNLTRQSNIGITDQLNSVETEPLENPSCLSCSCIFIRVPILFQRISSRLHAAAERTTVKLVVQRTHWSFVVANSANLVKSRSWTSLVLSNH